MSSSTDDPDLISDEMIDRGTELFAAPRLYEPDQPAKLRQFVAEALNELGVLLVPMLEAQLEQGDRLIVTHGGDVVVVSVRLEDEEAEELLDNAGNGSVNFVKRAIASALAQRAGYSQRGGEVGVTVTVHPDDALAAKLDLVLQSLQSERSRNDKRWRALMANLTELEAAVDALSTEEAAAATEMQALVAEIGTLQAGSVTQEQIDAITTKAQSLAEALSSATSAAESATAPATPAEEPVTPPPAPEPTPDPEAEGGTPAEETPAPAAPTEPATPGEEGTTPAEPGAPVDPVTPAPDAPAEEPVPADPPTPDTPAEGEGTPSDPTPPEDWTPDEG